MIVEGTKDLNHYMPITMTVKPEMQKKISTI